MKTLVIHPDDRSTDFLKLIYVNKNDWTIMNRTDITRKELIELIKNHDRIIMMGHGCPTGLFNPKRYSLLIDDSFAPLLKTKETISIWCHSDQYFRRNNIKGFHTGMIISEVSEALYVLGHAPLNKEQTLENMETFARIINQCIDETPEKMQEFILANYIFDDEVTQFNRKNILVLGSKNLTLYKYVYENKKYFKVPYDVQEYPTYVIYKDKNYKSHKVNKDNINKVLNQGDKGFILYSKENWNIDTFKSAIQDYLIFKKKSLNDQLLKINNLINEIN